MRTFKVIAYPVFAVIQLMLPISWLLSIPIAAALVGIAVLNLRVLLNERKGQ